MSKKKFTEKTQHKLGALDITEDIVFDYGDLEDEISPKEEKPVEQVKEVQAEIKEQQEEKNVVNEAEEVAEDNNKAISATKKKASDKGTAKSGSARNKQKKANSNLPKLGGRKKIYDEPRVQLYCNCGDETYEQIKYCSNKGHKKMTPYLEDLLRSEMAAFEKDQDTYVSTRRKKAESLPPKTGKKYICSQFSVSVVEFLDNIIYEINCTKQIYISTIVKMDYDKRMKK